METLEIFDKMFNNYFDSNIKNGGSHDIETIVKDMRQLFGEDYLNELDGLLSSDGLKLFVNDKLNYKLSKNRR
jgi:hypothetical protein